MNKEGLDALYFLKKRPREKKIIIMVGSIEQARMLKDWSEEAEELASKYWPGKTTLVLSDEQAVRIPGNKELSNLLIKKGPVYMSSANISGERQLTLEEAKETFKEIKEYYDFGNGDGKPSTIIKVSNKEILR